MLQLPITNVITCTTGAHALAFISVIFQAHLGWYCLEAASCQKRSSLYKNLTCHPHAACGYCVKLQHKNIRNDVRRTIHIYKTH